MSGDAGASRHSPQEAMWELIMGYWITQCVGVVARLGIPERLANGPKSSDELARETEANPDALYRLMRACASRGVFEDVGDRRFALTPVGATLRPGVPGSLLNFALLDTDEAHWGPWGKLLDVVKTGKSSTQSVLGMSAWDWVKTHPEVAKTFAGAMGDLSNLIGEDLPRAVDFSGVRKVVDVGGAHGMLLMSVLKACPSVSGVLMDLEHMTTAAGPLLEARGFASRCERVTGDFFQGVPPGADVYMLKSILHDWEDEQCRVLLTHCAKAVSPRGRVLVLELVIPDDNAPGPAQLMDLNMLVMLGAGRERTRKEYEALLQSSGLKMVAVHPTRTHFSIIEAVRR